MLRKLHYSITAADKQLTIGEYLQKRGYSHHILAGLKRSEEGIRLNGARVPISVLLTARDTLDIRLEKTDGSVSIKPVPVNFSIVYEDEDLLVVNKPANTPIHPSINNHENTLANGVIWYYQQKGIPFVFRCINRLDRDTSGLLILAKNALSASILSAALKKHEIKRTYLAIASGQLSAAVPQETAFPVDVLLAGSPTAVCPDFSQAINAPIARKEGSALERCVDFSRGEPALTRYCSLFYHEALDLTLLALRLETGRTHQIRVHMDYLGHPLIGDFLYHPRRDLIGRQALHSWRLEFIHPITKEPLAFQEPLPEDMQFILCP